jgi:ATP-dependent RNA circularization protein (DNA/RNA ligase family)
LQEKIFETPVTLSEKYDGTNVGVCEEGKLYGRNKLIPPTEKAYQKVDLQQVRDIDVGLIKAEFAKMIGVEND